MLTALRNKCDLSDRLNEWHESMVWISGGRDYPKLWGGDHTHEENARFCRNMFMFVGRQPILLVADENAESSVRGKYE